MSVHIVYKPLGWSPLEAINALRRQDPTLADEKMTYAGRLDPMAEGVLVVLSGQDRYQKDAYLHMDKVYEATIALGLSSDTYDGLGMVEEYAVKKRPDPEWVESFLCGEHTLSFPPYSSYKVNGKPLHFWAKNARLHEVIIPAKVMRVDNVADIGLNTKSIQEIRSPILSTIKRVRGDFRQNSIMQCWQEIDSSRVVPVVTCTLSVSSGTYIRSLAHAMGQALQTGGLLCALKRTHVGPYSWRDSVSLLDEGN